MRTRILKLMASGYSLAQALSIIRRENENAARYQRAIRKMMENYTAAKR